MPARPKNDSIVSEDELEDEQATSDEEDESDDESVEDDSDDEDSEDDNEDLTLHWKGVMGEANEEEDSDNEEDSDDEEHSDDEEDNDSEDEVDEFGINLAANESEDESGDESDDEDESGDEESDDSDNSNEFETVEFVKNKKSELNNLKDQKQKVDNALITKQEKQTPQKADKKSATKMEKISTPKAEKLQILQKAKQPQPEEQDTKKKVPFEQTKGNIKEKYAKNAGKSLYIRFPKRLPTNLAELEAYIKGFCSGVINIRRPRQPCTRFCLVDFDDKESCKKARKEICKVEVDGQRLHAHIPKTDSASFIEELVERRRKKLKELRAKKKLRKALGKEKNGKPEKVFTSAITVRNIPISASVEEVKKHFPDAVEFKLFYAKKPQETNWAVVTLPTTQDASKARRQKIVIGENQLRLSFVGQENKFKKKGKKQSPKTSSEKNKESDEIEATPVTGKNQNKKEKRKASGGENEQLPSKKVKRNDKATSAKSDFGNSPKKPKSEKSFKSFPTQQTDQKKQQENKKKIIKGEKQVVNSKSAKSPSKNENNSFDKKSKQTFQNKGSQKVNSEQNVKQKIGKNFNSKEKGKMQPNQKKMKGDFSKGKNISKKGKFHMKAMRP